MNKILVSLFVVVILSVAIIGISSVNADSYESKDSTNYLFLEIDNSTASGLLKINGKITSINSDIQFYDNGNFKINVFQDRLKLFGSLDKLKVTVLDLNERQKIFFDIHSMEIQEETIVQTNNQTKVVDNLEQELERLKEWRKTFDIKQVPIANYSNNIIEEAKQQRIKFSLGITSDLDDTITLGKEVDIKIYINNIRNNHDVEGAKVKLEIIRNDFVAYTFTDITDFTGFVYLDPILDYPLVYPNHCYDAKITATYGNFTVIDSEDFLVKTIGYDSWVNNVKLDWIDQSRYNHLPEEYTTHPREIERSDVKCNK